MASIRSGIKILSDVTKFKVSTGHIVRSFSAERTTTQKPLATHARSTSLQDHRRDPLTDGFVRDKPWYLHLTEHQQPPPPPSCNIAKKGQQDTLKVVPPFTLAAATKFCRKACEKVEESGFGTAKNDGEKKAIEFCKLYNKKREKKDSGKGSLANVAGNELESKEGVAGKNAMQNTSSKHSLPNKQNTVVQKKPSLVEKIAQEVLNDNRRKKLAIIASIKALKYPQAKAGENQNQKMYLKQKLINKEIEKNNKKTLNEPKVSLQGIDSKTVHMAPLPKSKISSQNLTNKISRLDIEKQMLVTSKTGASEDLKKTIELRDSKDNIISKDTKNIFLTSQLQELAKSAVGGKTKSSAEKSPKKIGSTTPVKHTTTSQQPSNTQEKSQFVLPRFYTLKELEARSFLTPSPSKEALKDVNKPKFEQPSATQKQEASNNPTKVRGSDKKFVNKIIPVSKSAGSTTQNNNVKSWTSPSTNASFKEYKNNDTKRLVVNEKLNATVTKSSTSLTGDQQVGVSKEPNKSEVSTNKEHVKDTHAPVKDPKGTVEVNIHFTNNSPVKSLDGKLSTPKEALKAKSLPADTKNSTLPNTTMSVFDKTASSATPNSNQGLPSMNNTVNVGIKTQLNSNSSQKTSMENIASVIVQETENSFKTKVFPNVSQVLQKPGGKTDNSTNTLTNSPSQELKPNLTSKDGLSYNYSKNTFEKPSLQLDKNITHPQPSSDSKDINKKVNTVDDLEKEKMLKTSDSTQAMKGEGVAREKENKNVELFPRIPSKNLEYNYSTNKYELKKINPIPSVDTVVQRTEITQLEIKSNNLPKRGTIILRRKVPKLDKEKPSVTKLTLELDFNYKTNKYEPKWGKPKPTASASTNKDVNKSESVVGMDIGSKKGTTKEIAAVPPSSAVETSKTITSTETDSKKNATSFILQKQSLTNQKQVHPTNASTKSSNNVTKTQSLSKDTPKSTPLKDDKKDFLKPGSSIDNPPKRHYSTKVSDLNPPADGPEGDWEMIVVKKLNIKNLVPPKQLTSDTGCKSMTQVFLEPGIASPLKTAVQPKIIKSSTKLVQYIPKPVFRTAQIRNLPIEDRLQKRGTATKTNKYVDIPKPYPTPLVTYQWFATLNNAASSVGKPVADGVKLAPNKSHGKDKQNELPQLNSKPVLPPNIKQTDAELHSFKPMQFMPVPTDNDKKPKLKHTSYSNESVKGKEGHYSKPIKCKPIHSDGYVRKLKQKRTASSSSVNVKKQPIRAISAHQPIVKSKKNDGYKAPFPETAQTLTLKKLPCSTQATEKKSTHSDAQSKNNQSNGNNNCPKFSSKPDRKNSSKTECTHLRMPGCRVPSSTSCLRGNLCPTTCTKVQAPKPSYSECRKNPSPPNRKTECKTNNALQPRYPLMTTYRPVKLPQPLAAAVINPDLAACCDSNKEQAPNPFECGKTTLLFPGLVEKSKQLKHAKNIEINEDGSRIVRLIKALMDLFRLKAVGIKEELEDRNGHKLLTSSSSGVNCHARFHSGGSTPEHRREIKDMIEKKYKSKESFLAKESIVAKLRNVPDPDGSDPSPAQPISPCHSNNKFRRNKRLRKPNTGRVKSAVVCHKIAAPGCLPRARMSCEREVFRPECLKSLAPSPSYSECVKRPFPKIPHSECRLREDKEKAFSELRSNRMSITTKNLEDALMKCLRPKTYGCETSKNSEKIDKLSHLCKSYDAKHVMIINNNPDGLLREIPTTIKQEHKNEPELDLSPVKSCMPPPVMQTPGNPPCGQNAEPCASFRPYKLPETFDQKLVIKPRRIRTCPRPSAVGNKKDCANMPVNEHEKIKLILKKSIKAAQMKAT